MTPPGALSPEVEARLNQIVDDHGEWEGGNYEYRVWAIAEAAYRLGLSQREAQPLPLPQGELSSDLRQLAMDMGPFWAGVLDSAAMHLDQHAQREAQLRALSAEWRSEIGGFRRHGQYDAADSFRLCADKIDALLTPQEPGV